MLIIVETEPGVFKKFPNMRIAKKMKVVKPNSYWYIYTENNCRVKIYPYGRHIVQQTVPGLGILNIKK